MGCRSYAMRRQIVNTTNSPCLSLGGQSSRPPANLFSRKGSRFERRYEELIVVRTLMRENKARVIIMLDFEVLSNTGR